METLQKAYNPLFGGRLFGVTYCGCLCVCLCLVLFFVGLFWTSTITDIDIRNKTFCKLDLWDWTFDLESSRVGVLNFEHKNVEMNVQ